MLIGVLNHSASEDNKQVSLTLLSWLFNKHSLNKHVFTLLKFERSINEYSIINLKYLYECHLRNLLRLKPREAK